jgi:hypothetical protein
MILQVVSINRQNKQCPRLEKRETHGKIESKINSPKQQSQSASDIGSKPYYCDHSFQSVVLDILVSQHLKTAVQLFIIEDFLVLHGTRFSYSPVLARVTSRIC